TLISYPAIASSPLVCETSLTTSTYQTGAMATYQLFTAVYGLDRSVSCGTIFYNHSCYGFFPLRLASA
ncbi:MAG: hypothetical protein RBR22_04745, partial [Desulfuromonas sp.]|nr:hypothetical protein [Desulfuromonas sp.]